MKRGVPRLLRDCQPHRRVKRSLALTPAQRLRERPNRVGMRFQVVEWRHYPPTARRVGAVANA
jgi:hypothetical protein